MKKEQKEGVDPTFNIVSSKPREETEEYKEYRRKWNENPKNKVVGDFPVHLDFETTTICNLKCYMCFQSFDPPYPAILDIDLFKKVIDEGSKKGLCSIKLQYRGEPLTDKRIPEMVKYAKDKGVIEVMFNTNATLLDEKMARALIEAGLNKIICSVDGCTKETYESVRIGATWEVTRDNILRLQKIKKEMGITHPIVRVQMVDTPRNHKEIKEYIEYWGNLVEDVAIEDMLDYKAEDKDETPLPNFSCGQLWQRLMILADGDVVPCCRAVQGGNNKLMVLGNIKEDTIENIWKGKALQNIRDLNSNGQSHLIDMCARCGLRKDVVNDMKK